MTSLPEEVLEQARAIARNAPPIQKHIEVEIAILLRPEATNPADVLKGVRHAPQRQQSLTVSAQRVGHERVAAG